MTDPHTPRPDHSRSRPGPRAQVRPPDTHEPLPGPGHGAHLPLVDAHVHVWDLARRALPWLRPGHPLRRTFRLTDLPPMPFEGLTHEMARSTPRMRGANGPARGATPELADADPAGGDDLLVLVQADADPMEVDDLLALARQTPSVVGVVGWFDLLDFPDRLPDDPRLVGVRSPPADQTDPDALTTPAHIRGVRAATEAGLAIDLLLRPSALIGAARLASAVPDARLVLDHLGNPTPGTLTGTRTDTRSSDWLVGLRALAECPNVSVKLSGTAHLATDDLRAMVDAALELFGSERLLFGSDWPVCTLAATRAEVLRRTTALLPPAAHNDVFRGTAQRIYRPRETAHERVHPPPGP